MATIDDLLNEAAVVRDEDQEQENTAFRVGTLLINVIQYLSTLITSEAASELLEDALDDFFDSGALKESALPPEFMQGLVEWSQGVAEKEASTYLLKLIHSRIILLDSMGSTLDGLDYTPVAGDLLWRTGYVWKYNGSDFEDGGIPPKLHVVYLNKHTGKPYMWNGSSMVEVGNHYADMIQITKMDQTSVANIPVGKIHYIPSQNKLVYRISNSKTHSWTPRTDLIYVDVSNNTLYRYQGSSFQRVSSDIRVKNNLTDGGEGDALSAEMGKTLMVAIQQILGALGNYAFPGGKPTIDWGGSSTVTYSVTYPTDSKVTHTGAGDTVELGSSLEVTLGIASGNDLYAIKDSSVKVYMSGVEQSGAYNASTQKVTIPAVTGNVVIVAEAWTYVSRGLVMHLDGRNRGGTAGKWKSLVDYNNSPLYFKLENCDEQSDYVAGNGTNSKGTAFSNSALTTPVTLLDVGAAGGTIEAAYKNAELNNDTLAIMHNGLGSGNRICLTSWKPNYTTEGNIYIMHSTAPGSDFSADGDTCAGSIAITSLVAGGSVSLKTNSVKYNGAECNPKNATNQSADSDSRLSIFWRKTSANERFFKLNLYGLRVYSVQLTDAERAQNLAIDQKRFNL